MTGIESSAVLTNYAQALRGARVLCVGDVMIDRYVDGAVKRISPESPVPVFSAGVEDIFPGGAANVARNVFALGGHCTLFGVIGDDEAARELASNIRDRADGVQLNLLTASDRPTTQKVRLVARGQHVLRIDTENASPVPEAVAANLVQQVAVQISSHDVLVLSDYGKGVLTDWVVGECISIARGADKPVIVDPKSARLERYASATLITPNGKEIHAACGIEPVNDEDAARAGRAALAMVDVEAILITRGEKGMSLARRNGEMVHIASCGRDVYDVVGAGDTVIGTLAMALAIGAPLETAARLANVAAGIVVGKRGTATVTPDELILALEHQRYAPMRENAPVILATEDIVRFAQARRAELKTVGFTNGVFDILHPGHVSLLQFSRAACDCLIVAINSDASVRRLKGPQRPINTAADRAAVLGALAMVDAVVIFDADTPIDLIDAIRPDLLVKGQDYAIDAVVGAEFVQSYGGRVLLAKLVPGVSSTNSIARARSGEGV